MIVLTTEKDAVRLAAVRPRRPADRLGAADRRRRAGRRLPALAARASSASRSPQSAIRNPPRHEAPPRVPDRARADRGRARDAGGRCVRGAGTLLGLAFYTLDGAHRRIAQRNLATAFPSRPEAERRAIARRAFAHFGRLLFELLKFSDAVAASRCWRASSSTARSASRLAYAQGKGVLFFTGHFGFWELHAMVHARAGRADRHAGARARQPAAERAARGHPAAHRQHRHLPPRHDPPRDADAAGRPRRRGADRSAHHEPRRDLRRLLRAAGGDDVGGGGAGAAHRRAGGAGVRAAARPADATA